MSYPSPATLYRAAATAGLGSAVVLLINAAKRAEVIPTTAFTQLVAPLAQILALALITGLYLAFGRRAGRFGLVAYLLNAVRPDRARRSRVRHQPGLRRAAHDHDRRPARGPTRRRPDRGVLAFLTGTIAFAVAMIRTREVPVAPLALYAVGAVPVSFRAFVPEAVLDLGLVALAVGAGWLAAWFFTRATAITTPANTAFGLAAQPPPRVTCPAPVHRPAIHPSRRTP